VKRCCPSGVVVDVKAADEFAERREARVRAEWLEGMGARTRIVDRERGPYRYRLVVASTPLSRWRRGEETPPSPTLPLWQVKGA
jgi:hypothetical protein